MARGPYMMRYESADDFGVPETAFNICAFWRLDALHRIGRRDEAIEIFEALLASRNHLGLMSEDTDFRPAKYGVTSLRLTPWWELSTVRCVCPDPGRIACEPIGRRVEPGGGFRECLAIRRLWPSAWLMHSNRAAGYGSDGTARLSARGRACHRRKRHDNVTTITLPLTRKDYNQFYVGYSNSVLWPSFHYRLDLIRHESAFLTGYKRVNSKFADALSPLLRDRRYHLGA